jgi:hypothetical protein
MTADFAQMDIDLARGFDSVDRRFFDHRHGLPVQRIVLSEPQTLTQASDALICIETNTTNVEIASIRQLIFNQGSLAQNAVSDGRKMT